jgi:hypothetical protein
LVRIKCVLLFFPKIGTGWGADIGDFVQSGCKLGFLYLLWKICKSSLPQIMAQGNNFLSSTGDKENFTQTKKSQDI